MEVQSSLNSYGGAVMVEQSSWNSQCGTVISDSGIIIINRFTLFRFLFLLEESYNGSVVFNTSFLNRRILKLDEICSAKSENCTPKSGTFFAALAISTRLHCEASVWISTFFCFRCRYTLRITFWMLCFFNTFWVSWRVITCLCISMTTRTSC